jgi:hypothetical protein
LVVQFPFAAHQIVAPLSFVVPSVLEVELAPTLPFALQFVALVLTAALVLVDDIDGLIEVEFKVLNFG